MTIDFDALLKLIGQLGVAIAMAVILWYAVFVPRKSKEGERRSALLVPGWIHEDLIQENERIRIMYAGMLKDEQERANVRITEWRGFRDEAVAKQVDAQQAAKDMLTALNQLAGDVSLLLELSRVAPRDDAPQPEPARAGRKGAGNA